MPRRSSILGPYFFLLALAGAPLAFGQAGNRPEDVLQERYGLKRVPGGNIWAVRLEFELREHWTELDQRRAAIVLLEQGLQDRIQKNARDWTMATQTELTIRALIALTDPTDAKRALLEKRLAGLKNGLASPEKIGDLEDVREQVVALVDRRNGLWQTAHLVRQKTPKLAEAYAALEREPRLREDLKKVGASHRLGPARNYVDDLMRLADYERLFETSGVPLFLQGDRQRVTLLVNGATPVTFTWTGSADPALITAAMAEAIGLEIPRDAREASVTHEKQNFRAKAATLASLRLGKYEVRDVDVLVLPPEAESLGARLSPANLKNLRATAQPDRLRLWVEVGDRTSP